MRPEARSGSDVVALAIAKEWRIIFVQALCCRAMGSRTSSTLRPLIPVCQ